MNLAMCCRSWHSTGAIYDAMLPRRTTVRLIVQFVATVLGALQLYVVGHPIRYRTNPYLRCRPSRLITSKLLSALWTMRLDTDLESTKLGLLCLFLVAAQVPAAIWAASITPMFSQVSYLSLTLTTLYASVYVAAFLDNIANVMARHKHSNATAQDTLRGLEDSLEAVLDAYLAEMGAAQFMLAEESTSTAAEITFSVMRLDNGLYIYLAFAINTALVLAIFLGAVVADSWTAAPISSVFDIKSAILAAAAARKDERLAEVARMWNGSAADKKVGGPRVRVSISGPALVAVQKPRIEAVLLEDLAQ
jgi:hypothetical protein